MKVSINQ